MSLLEKVVSNLIKLFSKYKALLSITSFGYYFAILKIPISHLSRPYFCCNEKERLNKTENIRNPSQQRDLPEKVATAIGIALNNYRKMERGKTVLINERLWAIAEALNVSVKELVLEEDPNTSSSLADIEREEYLKRIRSLEEEIDTLKQCVNILNEKNESYIRNRGSAYP